MLFHGRPQKEQQGGNVGLIICFLVPEQNTQAWVIIKNRGWFGCDSRVIMVTQAAERLPSESFLVGGAPRSEIVSHPALVSPPLLMKPLMAPMEALPL